jgi:hypothetical protein
MKVLKTLFGIEFLTELSVISGFFVGFTGVFVSSMREKNKIKIKKYFLKLKRIDIFLDKFSQFG